MVEAQVRARSLRFSAGFLETEPSEMEPLEAEPLETEL
jgi:hypothetical protein